MADIRNSTTTVSIGCKLPSGLIMEIVEPSQGRQLLPAPVGEQHILKGANSCLISTPFGRVSNGTHKYGVTQIPEDFAKAWFARNKDLECVKRGQVFILPSKDKASIEAAIKERESDPQTRTGLEPLVEKDPRLPKGVAKNQADA